MAEFNSPQQEPGMERKLLLVFALTFLVIMLFQPLMKKFGPQPPAKTESAQPATAQNAAGTLIDAQCDRPRRTIVACKAEPGWTQQAANELETVIENDVYRIVFTNRGGRVKSWVLKKYTDDKGGQLELVNPTASAKYGYPLTLWSYDEALRDKLNSALYVASAHGDPTVDQSLPSPLPAGYKLTAPATIVFKFGDGDISVEKTFTFDRSSYVVGGHCGLSKRRAGYGVSHVARGFRRGPERRAIFDWPGRVSIRRQSRAAGHQENQQRRNASGPLHWAGISDQYFAAVFVAAGSEEHSDGDAAQRD